ncbi:hypothetical protein ACQEU3_13575 [Spirillospora sp. CA-253888]
MDTTRRALDRAIAMALPGNRMGDIGHAVERTVAITPDGPRVLILP